MMRISAFLSVCLVMIAIGCSNDSSLSTSTSLGPSVVEPATQTLQGVTTVSLKVPNMH